MSQVSLVKTALFCCALALSACKSTTTNESVSSAAKPESMVTKKAKAIAKYNAASQSDINENEAFNNLALYFTSQVESLETAYGQVYFFTADGEGDELSFYSLPDFYPVAMDSVAKTCKGKTVKSSYFADIEDASDLDLAAYFDSSEQHQQIKEYSKGRQHYANIGKKKYIFQFINELSLNDSQVFYPNQVSQKNEITAAPQKGGPINCIENGEYKFYSYMVLGRAQKNYKTYNQKLIAVLIPSETANNMIKEIAQQSWLAAEPGIARIRAYELKQKSREKAYEASVVEDKARWDDRHETQLHLGDKVCSWDNKYGYIEETGHKNVKVLWKGQIYASTGRGRSQIDYPPGFFFGGSTLKNYDRSFKARIIDSMAWEPREQIANCNFR